jgi:hypothetical protein
MKRLFQTLLLVLAAISHTIANDDGGGKTPLSNYPNTIVLQWNTIALETMQGPNYNPMIASRVMAMVHVAIHDALNNISPVYDTYTYQHEDKKADPVAAISAAAHNVLADQFPDKREQLDKILADILRNVKAGASKDRGLALGAGAAKAILYIRNGDGAFADPVAKVTNPEKPGLYQATPPMPIFFAPFWKDLPTFGISNSQQFRVKPMPTLESDHYTKAFNEVKSKGAKESSVRTAEETSIAKFWYEFSEIGWNRVTAVAVKDANLDLIATARLFALVNMALADSYIAGWDSKIYHNFWRPYTAVRKASTDGNDQTSEDAALEPLMGTPPIHDYPSTHSVLGSAAATILTGILGSNTGFTMTSTSAEPAGYTRSFKSFEDAAIENADSRVYAGIHFRFSCEAGIKQGKDIGNWILVKQLKKKSSGKSL